MSIDVPTGNPATKRPPVMQSSMANSSATRTRRIVKRDGCPSTTQRNVLGPARQAAAMMLGDGISP